MNLLNNHTHLKMDSYRHGKMEQWVKCFDMRGLGFSGGLWVGKGVWGAWN